ncbi:hypothetical protein [Streptomyces sp. NBC_00525]|uniref:hypothetical protein n=1 Tax=Streptomyces sp. NBC_00525 TaxID=2903660 RepID=UPI002E800AF5|nr:hypothetical protein [Streptomyces sp. NBC_00525]WUC93634.1 hypothetical protein OG710_08455 [Streptomyces sp. NBC_00525]
MIGIIDMSRLGMRRVAVAAAVVMAGVALPIATAGTASASPSRCVISLKNDGYNVGTNSRAACSHASSGTGMLNVHAQTERLLCRQMLLNLNVKRADADDACYSY